MGREVTGLPLSSAPHLSAIAYLATVAYPSDWGKRDRFVSAGQAWLKGAAIRRRDRRTRLPKGTGAPRKRDIERTLDHAERLIRDRRRWAAAELHQELLRYPGKAASDTRSRRLAHFAGLAFRSADPSAAHGRIWKESLPVVHLAYGMMFSAALALPPPVLANPRGLSRPAVRAAIVRSEIRRKPMSLRVNFSVMDSYRWADAVGVRALIANPAWVAGAIAESERVLVALPVLGIDADSVRLIAE